MREDIGSRFDVNYFTKDYSNYLLIPYSTETYQCFGAYFILGGLESDRSDLQWSFIIDESKNKEFKKIVEQKDILGQAIMFGDEFEMMNKNKPDLFHYLLHKPSKKFIDFIIKIGNKEQTDIKQLSIDVDSKVNFNSEFELSLTNNISDNNLLLKKEETKIKNGESAELLVYETIKNSVDLKILGRELSKLFKDNKTTEIYSQIDKLIHYSKNFNTFAPFDLISTRGEEIIYIEVKSTEGNDIYFSINEMIFAYEHINNYQVKIVKDSTIYDLDITDLISDIYKNIKNHNHRWSFETIKLKLNFGNLNN